MMKKQRHEIIIDIIVNNEITTQEMLKSYLENNNINVTQATLSRDINELNLKKDAVGIYRYTIPFKSKFECPAIFRDSITEIVFAMNTVVIKCHTGMAQAACATLDNMQCPEIVGTIAGDDTIFALMHSEKEAAEFCGNLKDMLL